jgi:hypothetical protein
MSGAALRQVKSRPAIHEWRASIFSKVPSASERPYFTTRTAIFAAIAEQIPWCKVSQATTSQAKA